MRRTAALLAAVGMLALPAQAFAECPMPMQGTAHEAAPAAPAEHAEHDGVPEDPAHPVCPDLTHCVAPALTSATRTVAFAPATLPQAVATPLTAPLAPTRAVEPPPPRG
jgi:hypothetical protein